MSVHVLIVPEWADASLESSVLREFNKLLDPLAETSKLYKLPALRRRTPEASYLGLRVGEGELEEGPLIVSALGADPPSRSTHLHLSLMSTDGTNLAWGAPELEPGESKAIDNVVGKLNTKLLTVVLGEGRDYGLVWEKMGDFGTAPPDEAIGNEIRTRLPEGDGESQFRQFIDDSVNLLNELEFNHRRQEEGLSPINVLWPWGQGIRHDVPNLAIRYGSRVEVFSESLRLQGLARLASLYHSSRSRFGKGIQINFPLLRSATVNNKSVIVLADGPRELRKLNLLDELHWYSDQMIRQLIHEWLERIQRTRGTLLLLAPSQESQGIALLSTPETRRQVSQAIPFDERILEERTITQEPVERLVAEALIGSENE